MRNLLFFYEVKTKKVGGRAGLGSGLGGAACGGGEAGAEPPAHTERATDE